MTESTRADRAATKGGPTAEQHHTPEDLKAVAELLSDEARKLLWRLSERFETALTLPDDQAAYDELFAEDLADLNAGGLARLSETGRMLNEFLGPYREGKNDALIPNLKPPADPVEVQEAQRKKAEDDAKAEAKATEDAERAAKKEPAKAG